VWHASVAAPGLSRSTRRRLALKALRGVGDPGAQWEDARELAYHVRRRLRPAEAVGIDVRDLRGTAEGRDRWRLLRAELPPQVWPLAEEELGSI
jgi:hypothetical protein